MQHATSASDRRFRLRERGFSPPELETKGNTLLPYSDEDDVDASACAPFLSLMSILPLRSKGDGRALSVSGSCSGVSSSIGPNRVRALPRTSLKISAITCRASSAGVIVPIDVSQVSMHCQYRLESNKIFVSSLDDTKRFFVPFPQWPYLLLGRRAVVLKGEDDRPVGRLKRMPGNRLYDIAEFYLCAQRVTMRDDGIIARPVPYVHCDIPKRVSRARKLASTIMWVGCAPITTTSNHLVRLMLRIIANVILTALVASERCMSMMFIILNGRVQTSSKACLAYMGTSFPHTFNAAAPRPEHAYVCFHRRLAFQLVTHQVPCIYSQQCDERRV